jgi:hypothetical protein
MNTKIKCKFKNVFTTAYFNDNVKYTFHQNLTINLLKYKN